MDLVLLLYLVEVKVRCPGHIGKMPVTAYELVSMGWSWYRDANLIAISRTCEYKFSPGQDVFIYISFFSFFLSFFFFFFFFGGGGGGARCSSVVRASAHGAHGAMGRQIDPSLKTHGAISRVCVCVCYCAQMCVKVHVLF